jgi:hypothetical protein
MASCSSAVTSPSRAATWAAKPPVKVMVASLCDGSLAPEAAPGSSGVSGDSAPRESTIVYLHSATQRI